MPTTRLAALLEAAASAERVLVLTHNDPDPDAISSAVALRHLLLSRLHIPAKIAYRGIIGRAENKALVRYLDRPLEQFTRGGLAGAVALALVDTQPGAGNGPLRPADSVAIVIDHHPLRAETASARFADVRPDVGSTSTILTQYLQAAGVELPATLATALFYGIKSDTMGLGRSGSDADRDAYSFLLSYIDSQALFEIERAQVPAQYFRSLIDALEASHIYRDVLITYLGSTNYPDMAAEVADWLLRLKGIQWVVCLGAYKESMIVAVRSRHPSGGAGRLALAVVGELGTAGGHGSSAGGQVRLNGRDPDGIARQISDAVLAFFDISPEETQRALLPGRRQEPSG